MNITIKEDGIRFGVRAGAILYNEDKSKILLERQTKDRYMFPGGRIEVCEDSESAIVRELEEELGINVDLKLKYIAELFLKIPNGKYHEIGFYYLAVIKENMITNGFHTLDGDGTFEWIDVSKLNNYEILEKPIKDKIVNGKTMNYDFEHLVYREY